MLTEEVQAQLTAIAQRNLRVEIDKAWERSWTRRLTIAVITYVFASLWLVLIGEKLPLLKAAVPVVGYLLSTVSLPIVKKRWMLKK